jgi:hypothetical protein
MPGAKQYFTEDDDIWYTPPEALDPLFPFLKTGSTIWEPACGSGSLVDGFKSHGHNCIGTDITTGHDFLITPAPVGIDYIITNPPFSLKDGFLEKCYRLEKPFALLLPITGIGSQPRKTLFSKSGLEVVLLDRRIHFHAPGKKKRSSWDETAWFTYGLNIGRRIELLPASYHLLAFNTERKRVHIMKERKPIWEREETEQRSEAGRKIESCNKCSEEKEIAAHGLCFACYRAEVRSRKTVQSPDQRKEKIRLMKLQATMRTSAVAMGFDGQELKQLDMLCAPHLDTLTDFVNSEPEAA